MKQIPDSELLLDRAMVFSILFQ